MKLTEYQKDFLLEYFFKSEKYPGWKNIATQLLEIGNCVVAGTGCLWHGGIGNFINTNNSEGLIDCTLYEFDLESFLKSDWFKEVSDSYISILSDKKKLIEDEYEQIYNL